MSNDYIILGKVNKGKKCPLKAPSDVYFSVCVLRKQFAFILLYKDLFSTEDSISYYHFQKSTFYSYCFNILDIPKIRYIIY